jgi:uncharacterized protein YjiS (DUF1127 family)
MTTYSQSCTHSLVADNTGALENLLNLFRGYGEKLILKHRIEIERQQLLEMSDSMLTDIGIDRFQATREAARNDIPAARLETLGKQ